MYIVGMYIYIILCMYNCIAIKHDKTTQQSRIMGSTSRIAKWTQSKQVEGPVFGLPVSSQKICWTTIASPGLLRQFWSLTVTSSLFSSHSYPIKKTRLNHINWSLNHPQFRIFFCTSYFSWALITMTVAGVPFIIFFASWRKDHKGSSSCRREMDDLTCSPGTGKSLKTMALIWNNA